MRTYKPEGATHYGENQQGKTIWYKHNADGSWDVWWDIPAEWYQIPGQPAVAVRRVISDTGANQ